MLLINVIFINGGHRVICDFITIRLISGSMTSAAARDVRVVIQGRLTAIC